MLLCENKNERKKQEIRWVAKGGGKVGCEVGKKKKNHSQQ